MEMQLLKISGRTVLVLAAALTVASCQMDPTGATVSITRSSADTGSATLSWQAPTTNTDGSALTDLAGYRIYFGSSADNLSQAIALTGVGIQTYVVDGLTSGTWYFAVRAVASDGAESALSEIVSKTV